MTADAIHASPRVVRDPARLFAPPRVEIEQRAHDRILRSPMALRPHARCAGEWLVDWATRDPSRVFLCERPAGDVEKPWTRVTYGDALARVEAIGTYLLAHGLTPDTPVAVLSDNSIDHALLSLAAQHVGIPIASISPAYSLLSNDFDKLKKIVAQVAPGAIYVPAVAPFAAALSAIAPLHTGIILSGTPMDADEARGIVAFAAIQETIDRAAIDAAFRALNPDTVAKLLFTSGSTGEPKGVINTQRMICASQEAKAQVWPFVETTPPVTLDWLPWSHTFGANHNFNLILRNGGTFYIDGGKPVPGLFQRTLANIDSSRSTVYFNVPRGFDMLVDALSKDAGLARAFFEPLQVIFYAGAALPQNIWDALIDLSVRTIGEPVAMVSAWGSTETSPLASDCHFQAERAGTIGLPIPGCEFKLVRNGDKEEIRVRGANVTPGYHKRRDLTEKAFDDEGFYVIGDAVKFVDEAHPEKGLLFDGRVAEDFKLMSGTWVSVGMLRVAALEALAPVAQDVVVTGHDREDIGFLVFANIPACRALAGLAADAPAEEALAHPAVRHRVAAGLASLKGRGGGSSTYATRALLMAEPASVDAGEITDKGYVNQRAVLTRRAALVSALYAGDPRVIGLEA